MLKVLFVCTGNICRSPTAEGVFRALVRSKGLEGTIGVDSAGTHAYHVGEPPDLRSQAAALRRGFDLSTQRARKVCSHDFQDYTLLLAMDRSHLQQLQRSCPAELRHKVQLFMDYAPSFGTPDVPDPYYGEGDGFERVLDMIEAGSQALLDHLTAQHLS